MKKHFFFDMDGTITRSRSEISDTMIACLRELISNGRDVIVVSGATKGQIMKQIGEITKEVVVMAQNGNHTETSTGEVVWRNELNNTQKSEIFSIVSKMISHANIDVRNPEDLVEDRICQISYSLIGHNAPLKDKEAIDPDKVIRKSILGRLEIELAELNKCGVQAGIGGTTCVDFTTRNKGDNVKLFLEHMGWDKDECMYVGDALFAGGNDHSVVGIIPTQAVSSHIECEELIGSFVSKF